VPHAANKAAESSSSGSFFIPSYNAAGSKF
jgi:hypothetical protein